jgi:ankyrin repeat protein
LQDRDGFTPLMTAVLATPTHADIVRTLLERGADVSYPERRRKWTALHFAARDCGPNIVRILLEAGANVDARNAIGSTPLFENIMSPQGDRRLLGA